MRRFPPGWDEEKVRKVLAHYEEQTEEEATTEDEAAPHRVVKSDEEAITVTDLLKKAFDAASRLPEDEQDPVAEGLLAELGLTPRWRTAFAYATATSFIVACS